MTNRNTMFWVEGRGERKELCSTYKLSVMLLEALLIQGLSSPLVQPLLFQIWQRLIEEKWLIECHVFSKHFLSSCHVQSSPVGPGGTPRGVSMDVPVSSLGVVVLRPLAIGRPKSFTSTSLEKCFLALSLRTEV